MKNPILRIGIHMSPYGRGYVVIARKGRKIDGVPTGRLTGDFFNVSLSSLRRAQRAQLKLMELATS